MAYKQGDFNCYNCAMSLLFLKLERMDRFDNGSGMFQELKRKLQYTKCPFFKAIMNNSVAEVKPFLDKPEFLHKRDEFKNTALHISVICQSEAATDLLLSTPCVQVNKVNMYGWSPLYVACVLLRHPPTVDRLLAARANVDTSSADWVTPLHWAAAGDPPTTRRLLSYGADVDLRDRAGQTPLHYASNLARPDLIRLLLVCRPQLELRDCRGNTPLHLAAAAAHDGADAVRLLVAAGAVVTARNLAGLTPLHRAIKWHRPAALAALLASGASVNERTARGHTPLHLALPDEAAILIEAGARIDLTNAQGDTPLHASLASHAPSPLLALLGGAGDVNVRDSYGCTPLCLLLQTPAVPETATLGLLAKGADVNVPDYEGNTPLHYAVRHNPDQVPALLCHDADVTAPNVAGQTPILLALTHRTSAAEPLLECDLDWDTVYDESILGSALRHRPDLVAYVLSRGASFCHLNPRHGCLSISTDVSTFNLVLNTVGYDNVQVGGYDSLLDYAVRYPDQLVFKYLVENDDLYEFLDSSYYICPKTLQYRSKHSLIKHVINHLTPEEAYKMIYVLLSHGYVADFADVKAVLAVYGWGRLFYFMMDLELVPQELDSPLDLVLAVMFDVGKSVNEHIFLVLPLIDAAQAQLGAQHVPLSLQRIVAFFRNPKLAQMVQKFAEGYDDPANKRTVEMFASQVPSLQELARDRVRDAICAQLETGTYGEFCQRTAHMSYTIRNIVRFIKPLYSV